MTNEKNEIIKYLKSQFSPWDVITSKEVLVETLVIMLPPLAIGIFVGTLLIMTTNSDTLMLCVIPLLTVAGLNIFYMARKRQKTIQSNKEQAEKQDNNV